jgi:TubC N-terminal docking domain
MNTAELLGNLNQKGVQLWIDRDKLKINSPKGIITPELSSTLAARKQEILAFLRAKSTFKNPTCKPFEDGLSLETIGNLIKGSAVNSSPPTIDARSMAQKLKVTFRPLPDRYKQESIIRFREELERKLQNLGVQIVPWQEARRNYNFDVKIPFTSFKQKIETKIVRADINAIVDVERPNSIRKIAETFTAEKLYQFYSRFILKDRKTSIPTIAKLIGWAEDHAAKSVEDPNNTQVIILSELDSEFVNSPSYQQKISIGVNTLIRTFSEIAIGVSDRQISILNMNLSDSLFKREETDKFVLKSLVPKIYVPIAPLLLNKFEIGQFDPDKSNYAAKLVQLGKELADTGLFPAGFKFSQKIKRQSYRDIVDAIANGRTGVSYGFVAYAEPPKYIGSKEISDREWRELSPVEGYPATELRQNNLDRYYVKIKRENRDIIQQIPDIWLVSSRSGSSKTNLNRSEDILRVGLSRKLLLELPQGIDPARSDIKPSYDLYVMLGIALSTALYLPELIKDGAPIVHFHGYPSSQWFKENEYNSGVNNPSVPCGTYESGIFNYLNIYRLASRYGDNLNLASLIEPDHGTNIIASNLEYLLTRLKDGCKKKEIELGGKYFSSLRE